MTPAPVTSVEAEIERAGAEEEERRQEGEGDRADAVDDDAVVHEHAGHDETGHYAGNTASLPAAVARPPRASRAQRR